MAGVKILRTIREGSRLHMQTAVLRLRHQETGRRLTVCSMIHIARPEFYQRIIDIINAHDGDVLFEGVGELTPEQLAELSDEQRRVYESLAQLNNVYRQIAATLGLVAQPDAMPKPRPQWVRADLPVRELLDRWLARRLPLIPLMDAGGDLFASPFTRRLVSLALLQEPYLLGALRMTRGSLFGLGRMTALLLDERNTAALAAFDALPDGNNALIMYGAGHIPGLLDGFRARGFRGDTREWVTAHTDALPFAEFFQRSGAPRADP